MKPSERKTRISLSRLFSLTDRGGFSPVLRGTSSPDVLLLAAVLALSVFGTLMVFSAGYAYAGFRYGDPGYFIRRQTLFLLAGFLVMFLSSRVPERTYYLLAPYLYLLTVVLLLLVLFIGLTGNGAQRWISLGPITIQPSEIGKLTLVLMLARYFYEFEPLALDRKSKKNLFLYGTLFPGAILLLFVVLVMLQKHLSCIIILSAIGLLMMIVAGVGLYFIRIGAATLAAAFTALALFTDYTKERITVWRDPEAYRLTGGWQTLQGLMAIGSGGLFGRGFGQSQLKYCYVSEPANDMIFAIVCEELGFFGALLVLFLFALLVVRGYRIALHASNAFTRLVAFGITTKIAIQVLLNVAVVTNTIPNTGISLPFFSYGGSSFLMLSLEMGMLLSISRSAKLRCA